MQARALDGASLPPRLRDLAEPPERVFVVGELPRGPWVAIVGTRSPTRVGLAYTSYLAGALAAEGVVVASGGAVGIDTAAHRGALEAGGATVVLAPSSADRPYPEGNVPLFRRIVQSGGALLSPYEADVPASPPRFFQRNAFLAALAHVVIVVETRYRGGARNTSAKARDLGRPVFVVSPAPWNPAAAGCFEEIRLGARPLRAPRDVLDLLRSMRLYPMPPPGAIRPPEFVAPSSCYRVVDARGRGCETDPAGSAELAGQRPDPVAAGPGAVPQAAKAEPARAKSRKIGQKIDDSDIGGDDLAVLEAVRGGHVETDAIVGKTGLSVARVRASVLALTLKGLVASLPSGQVKLLTH